MDLAAHLDTAAFAAVGCGLLSWFVPRLIALVPEPAEERAEPAEDRAEPAEERAKEPPKELYADIARRPGLAWKSALAGAVAGFLLGGALGWDWPLTYLLPFVPVGVALAVVDWRTMLLPIRLVNPSYLLVLAAILIGWLVHRNTDDVVRAGWGWLVAGGLFVVLWFVYPRGLGYGDVRLAGVLGLGLGYLGWGPLLIGVYGGFLLGGVGGGLLSLLRIVARKNFPFGPFMLVGALVGVVWGEQWWTALMAR